MTSPEADELKRGLRKLAEAWMCKAGELQGEHARLARESALLIETLALAIYKVERARRTRNVLTEASNRYLAYADNAERDGKKMVAALYTGLGLMADLAACMLSSELSSEEFWNQHPTPQYPQKEATGKHQ